jgi:Stress responsive A/B Barrel Domain
MVVHMVLFKFSSTSEAEEAVLRLQGMVGKIPGLLGVEAGLDFTRSERSFDVGLVTRHTDAEALAVYQGHPAHQEVVAFIRPRATASAAADFVVP